MTVIDTTPLLTEAQRIANVRAGLCHCGCPARTVGRFGWHRCMFSGGMEFRMRRGRIQYRGDYTTTLTLREWNNVKIESGLPNDRQVHALLLFLSGWR